MTTMRALAFAAVLASVSACSAPVPPSAPKGAAVPAARPALHDVTVETGTLEGADFRIDVPKAWNHGLVVWFHGYAATPVRLPAKDALAPQLAELVARGYAVAQSAYSQTGWAVEQGAGDGERLRQYFAQKYGSPAETFATGMSMGGTLVVLTLEEHADAYAGGLSLCGAIESSDALLQKDFLLLTAFDFYFPGVLGPLVPVAADYVPSAAAERRIATALQSKPEAAQSLLRLWGVGNLRTLGDVIAFNYYELGEMQRRTHGQPFDNADYIYTGTHDDRALNDGVRRYRADAGAAAYAARWYTPSGKLTRPLLALHDVGDPLVPASGAYEYARAAQRTGHVDNFVQQYVGKDGHCVFTPDEVAHAFDELVAWVHGGARPPSGVLPAR